MNVIVGRVHTIHDTTTTTIFEVSPDVNLAYAMVPKYSKLTLVLENESIDVDVIIIRYSSHTNLILFFNKTQIKDCQRLINATLIATL